MTTKKNVISIIAGLLILTVGIPLLIHAKLGLDPLSCFVDSLSKLTTIQYGTMLTIVNCFFLLFHFIKKRNIVFTGFGLLMSITMGTLINMSGYILDYVPNEYLFQQIILFICGFIAMCFGIALIQAGRVQKMPFEGFQQAVADMINKDINVIRVYVEIVLFVLAMIVYAIVILFVDLDFILYDTVNVCTIFIMLLTGPTVNLIYKKILKQGEKENE